MCAHKAHSNHYINNHNTIYKTFTLTRVHVARERATNPLWESIGKGGIVIESEEKLCPVL